MGCHVPQEVKETLSYKSVSAFFKIINSSLSLKEYVSSETTHFHKKYMKIILKPMKHNKNADTLLSLLSFTNSQREKNIERTFFVSSGTKQV